MKTISYNAWGYKVFEAKYMAKESAPDVCAAAKQESKRIGKALASTNVGFIQYVNGEASKIFRKNCQVSEIMAKN